jgi:hypothetical protein
MPVEFLMDCSVLSLKSFELTCLERASSARKELRVLMEALIEIQAQANFARWMLEHRAELLELARTNALQKTLDYSAGGLVESVPFARPHNRDRV